MHSEHDPYTFLRLTNLPEIDLFESTMSGDLTYCSINLKLPVFNFSFVFFFFLMEKLKFERFFLNWIDQIACIPFDHYENFLLVITSSNYCNLPIPHFWIIIIYCIWYYRHWQRHLSFIYCVHNKNKINQFFLNKKYKTMTFIRFQV